MEPTKMATHRIIVTLQQKATMRHLCAFPHVYVCTCGSMQMPEKRYNNNSIGLTQYKQQQQ